MRSYRPILGLLFVFCLFLAPFVSNYVRYVLGFSSDPTNGKFAGIVRASYIGDDAATGKTVTHDLGPVVVEYEQRPLMFSYLSRVQSSARIADAKGNERTVKIVGYHHWQIAWQGPSGQLFTSGSNDDILQAEWNTKVDPFELVFKQTYEFPRKSALGAGAFRLTGTLQPASKDTYDLLRKQIANKSN